MSRLNEQVIDYSFISEFENSLLKEHQILPMAKDDFSIAVALTTESNLEYLTGKYHLPLKKTEVSLGEILFVLDAFEMKKSIYENYRKSIGISDYSSSYINNFVDTLIEFALYKNSSDIHIETQKNALTIRFRIDGLLHHFFMFELEFYTVISSVIKLLSAMDITQRRKPQNGRFSKTIENRVFDFRVSIMPTIHGESIVIRILDKKSVNKSLNTLGFEANDLSVLNDCMNYSQGLILITGPTGSGKTTTLYAMLQELNSVNKKIITIEDPVEYQIKNIQQIAINPEIHLGFVEVLKDVLRQDPDILMIGEIRDIESLKIAIQASLTGHLVLATLHSNDCISTINRLLDLQAEPFLIASTLKAVISQRLALKLCEDCKTQSIMDGIKSYEAHTCPKCNLSGFKGRLMLNEILLIDENISSMIAKSTPTFEILEYATNNGFIKLHESGLEKVKKGLTTFKEVYKVTKC